MSYWYSQYRNRSIGRISHFIQVYCGLEAAENCCFGGNDMITLYSEPFAEIKWGPWDVPVFKFLGENKEHYTRQQELKRKEAITACFALPRFSTENVPAGYEFIGHIIEPISFMRGDYHYDCYHSLDLGKILARTNDGDRFGNFFGTPKTEAEREAVERIKALYNFKS